MLNTTTPSFGNKVICWYTGFTFETFIKQYKSIVFPPFLEGFPFLARLYESTGKAIAVTTATASASALASASASASALLKMLTFLVKVFKSLYLLNPGWI